MRLAPAYDSHDLADATRRDGFSDPRFRASSPTTHRAAASSGQGRRRLSAGKSNSPATYRKDGSSERSETSPAFTSCGIARTSIAVASSPVRSAHAIAELVVPRSIPTLYRASPAICVLRQLDFGRCDDGAARRAERRKLDAGRAPARVEERAAERRLPGHVPDEVEGRGIDLLILSDRDSLAFPAGKDRLERHIAFEHAAAACVDVTRGRADLRVGVGGEVLEDEVDEPAFALQQGEHLDGTIRGYRQRWAEPAPRRERQAGAQRAGGL